MGLNLGCNGWEIETKDPPMRWDDHPAHKPAPINTDFPVLFLSTRRDPVTPLHAALKMTRKFANASIVEQVSDGHCTISCISLCTIGHIRAYVNDGILPPAPKFGSGDGDEGEWTTCECDEKPWNSFISRRARGGPVTQQQGKLATSTTNVDERYTSEEVETMTLYDGLRSHFVSQTMSQLVGEFNPLGRLVMGIPSHPFEKHQTCSQRRPNA